MSGAACAKWLLCSGQQQINEANASPPARSGVVQTVLEQTVEDMFRQPSVAASLELMYDSGRSRAAANRPMNKFFALYEAQEFEKAWAQLKVVQEEIR